MSDTFKNGEQHRDSRASAERRKASLENLGTYFQKVDVQKAQLPGLTMNKDSSLDIWMTQGLISALERRSARLEVVLSSKGLAPTIILDEFRGSIRAGFRSSDAAFVMERARSFNMRALFYEDSYMEIGRDTSCNSCSVTLSDASVSVGRDCMFSHDVTLQPSDQHDILDIQEGSIINHKRSIVLEDHVWVGKEAYLGAGCHIGEGAIVGARSVVVGRVEANTIVAGNPARLIRAGATWRRQFNSASASGEVYQP